jgi:RNA polymerase sigma factor (sigma-70 family)
LALKKIIVEMLAVLPAGAALGMIRAVDESQTTASIERYLHELANVQGEAPAEPIVRALLARAVDRLHALCASLLHRSYPRLTRGPLNLESDEMLGAVVERLIKAMRQIRPATVREFFALANQHMRWELNDLARRLDNKAAAAELRESHVAAAQESSSSQLSASASRILLAIEDLPEEEREVFSMVKIQGMTQPETAGILGISPKTVQRRLNRAVALLAEALKDLQGPPRVP